MQFPNLPLECTYKKNLGWIQTMGKTTEWHVNDKWLPLLLSVQVYRFENIVLSAQGYTTAIAR